MHGTLQLNLLQQQMNTHARSMNTFREQLRWQRRSDGLWLFGAVAVPAIPLASDDATSGHCFDFDLFAVFLLASPSSGGPQQSLTLASSGTSIF